jgi:hypothetical protein
LISPDVRRAWDQFRDGIASGRITAAAFTGTQLDIRPTTITPTLIEVQAVEIGAEEAPGSPSGGNPSHETEALASAIGPQPRTRSTL